MADDHVEALLAEGAATENWERRHEIAVALASRRPDVALPLVLRLFDSGQEGAVALGGELIEAAVEWDAAEHAERRAALIPLVAERMTTAAGEAAAIGLLRAAVPLADAALLGPVLALAEDPARSALALLGNVEYLEDFLHAEDEDDARRTRYDFVIAAGRTGDPRLHAALVMLRDLGFARDPMTEAVLASALEATRPT